MLNKLRNSLYRFIYGRNGTDSLNRALFIPIVLLFALSMFTQGNVRIIVSLFAWALIIYMYFRTFSKNIVKRRKENDWYERKINYIKTRARQAKQYRFFTCPNCKTHLRVPRGVGKITITCKKCGTKFDRKA